VRQYAYHDMHSLRIAPGLGHTPLDFFQKLGLRFYLEDLVLLGQDERGTLRPTDHNTSCLCYLQPFLQ